MSITPDTPDQSQQQPAAATDTTAATVATQPTPPAAGTPPTQAAPTPAPSSAGSPPPPAAAAAPQQNQPHPVSRVFDSILKSISGGPINVTDPVTGQRREVPQSRSSMAKTITAAALAGLFTPNQYRQGAFGANVLDKGNTMAAAGQAGQQVYKGRQEQAQKLTNDQQTAKLNTIRNNAELVKNMAASTLQQHAASEAMIASNKPMMDSIHSYEDTLSSSANPDQPHALIAENLSREDALAKLKGHQTEWSALHTGAVSVWNPELNKEEMHPTYSIVNPSVKVPLNEDAVNALASVNPTFKDAWKNTNGKVIVKMSQAVQAQHLVSESHIVQNFADSKDLKAAFPGMKPGNIAAALRSPNGRQLADALDSTRDAIASGQATYETLNSIRSAKNGRALLDVMGLNPDEVNKYIDEQHNLAVSKNALAKEGGVGDKAPVSPAQQKVALDAAGQLKDGPAKKSILSSFPKDRALTMGELDKVNGKVQAEADKQREDDIKSGDPAELAKTANNLIEGDLTMPSELLNARSNVRDSFSNIMQDEARKRGLDPTRYTFEAQKARAVKFQDYNNTKGNATGAQLNSFNTLMGHVAEGVDANDAWVRSKSPLLNHPISWLATNAGDDQDFKRFQTTIIAPAKEYMNFLNANRAEHEGDINAMKSVLNDDSTPASVMTALRAFAATADIRAANLGRSYLSTVGNNFANLITPQSAEALKRLGVQSQAAPLSRQIPRGWRNNSATPITPQVFQQILQASGNDAQNAAQIAKENGWGPPAQKQQ